MHSEEITPLLADKASRRKAVKRMGFSSFCFIYLQQHFNMESAKFHSELMTTIEGPDRMIEVIGFRGSANRQPLTAKILTRKGFVQLKDLKPGDKVIGSDGQQTKIEWMSEIVDRPIYELTTEDGRKAQCDAEHLWTVRKMTNVKEKYVTIPLQKIIDDGLYYNHKEDKRGYPVYKEYKFAIDTVKPVSTVVKWQPIEPYFLGLWLGDGNVADVRITNMDPEIIDYLKRYAQRLGLKCLITEHSPKGKAKFISITRGFRGRENGRPKSLTAKLKKLNLIGRWDSK